MLVATTFHPNWLRTDGAAVYAVTPFYMLTFVDKPVIIAYGRRQADRLGLAASAITLFVLIVITGFYCAKRLRSSGAHKTNH